MQNGYSEYLIGYYENDMDLVDLDGIDLQVAEEKQDTNISVQQ